MRQRRSWAMELMIEPMSSTPFSPGIRPSDSSFFRAREPCSDQLQGPLRRLMTVPSLGPVTASAIAASVQDVSAFSGPREFAAFLGLTPRQNSSGGKEQLGRISKMGNRYLRKLLVVGAHAVLYHRKPHEDALRSFAKKLMQTKPFKLVAVALANKMARIAFAIMRGRTTYTAAPV